MGSPTPAALPGTPPAAATSLHTALSTLEGGIAVLERVLPEVAMIGGLVPGATPFIQLAGLALPAVQNAIKFIMEEEGKSPLQAFEDFLNHIGPGQPNNAALTTGPANPT
jgi:hypothetical protein